MLKKVRIGAGLRRFLAGNFPFSWRDFLVSVIVLANATALCYMLRLIDSSDVYVALIFELAVVLVARFTSGYLFGLMASVFGVVWINYIFTYPYYKLNFTISGYPLTFLIMLAVTLAVSTLTSQIKRQEKIRAEAEKEKMRGNLLRAVSHDIRTPLTSIMGGIDTILDGGQTLSPAVQRQLLRNMRDESSWLIGVVENLLSVTRVSGGAADLHKELEAGEEVLGAAAMKIQRRYPELDVQIHAPQALLMVPMDAILIQQVLINLMENSIQHGKTTTQLTLRLFQQAQQVVFEVEDNGEGIDGEIMPHLFRGYLSVSQSAASDRKRNMGIGLSACMSIVQAHGGSMQAENTPHGALLRFSLPLDCTKPDANISQQEVCIHEDSGENPCSGR